VLDVQPVRRESVGDQVFGRLRDAILTGGHPAGSALPAERELAESFGCNRHAVREALRRLQQVRLVRVSQGEPTRVLDWRETGGLELVTQLAETGDALPVATLVRDVLEMRATVGADAARCCALRGTDADLAAVNAAARAYAAAEPAELHAADVELWRRIVLGSGNTAYLLSFNTLVAGPLAVAPEPPGRRADELLDVAGHLDLAELIGRRDAEGAFAKAREVLATGLGAGRRGEWSTR
jgi:GntR family transcriptional regulator, transcriptional repressor for pyruvate dehydrogenase complex